MRISLCSGGSRQLAQICSKLKIMMMQHQSFCTIILYNFAHLHRYSTPSIRWSATTDCRAFAKLPTFNWIVTMYFSSSLWRCQKFNERKNINQITEKYRKNIFEKKHEIIRNKFPGKNQKNYIITIFHWSLTYRSLCKFSCCIFCLKFFLCF